MSDKKSSNNIIKHVARELSIKYPISDYLSKDEMKRPQNIISKYGVSLQNNRTMMEKKGIPVLLNTDDKGANKVYGKIADSDKYTDGKNKYVSTSSLKKVMSDRIEEPRDPLKREILKYNEKCLDAFRDSEELENSRSKDEARISNELPKLAKKIRKERKIDRCEATNEPLEKGFAAHHLDRKADNPNKALDRDNIKIVNRTPHIEIHSKGYEGETGFKRYRDDYKKR